MTFIAEAIGNVRAEEEDIVIEVVGKEHAPRVTRDTKEELPLTEEQAKSLMNDLDEALDSL